MSSDYQHRHAGAEPATPFFDTSPESLRPWFTALGEPGYRADQLVEWVYEKGATSFEQMTNLPRPLRQRSADCFTLYESVLTRQQGSSDGTIKLLLQWSDGATSECVMIPEGDRRTACISTQVGCPVGCVFCASGLGGLQRNLSAGQIVEQAMRVRQLCGEDHRLSNIVFMGLGEPLANYDATLYAVRTINAPWGMGIGARKITISTVGLPKQIKRLAEEQLQVNLAISLHAPNDELRRELIPWAEGVTIDALTEAAQFFFDKTGREVTLEYILLAGVNDSAEHAAQLARVSKRMRSNVNLIVYNPVAGLAFRRPGRESVLLFVEALRAQAVNAHVRRSRGLDIDAACGQLRRREQGAVIRLESIS